MATPGRVTGPGRQRHPGRPESPREGMPAASATGRHRSGAFPSGRIAPSAVPTSARAAAEPLDNIAALRAAAMGKFVRHTLSLSYGWAWPV